MGREQFENFLNKQTASNQIDWNAKLERWKKAVEKFNAQIESYIAPYKERIELSHFPVGIQEDHIGGYKVEGTGIKIGTNMIRIQPIGTNIIGAQGRIDMSGPRGTVKFVLVKKGATEPQGAEDESKEAEWMITAQSRPVRFVPLDENSFYDCLMSVANG